MLIQSYTNHLQKLVKARNFLVIGLGCSIFLNLLLAGISLRLSNNTRTILLPAKTHAPMWVEDQKLSVEYLKQMSDYFISLFLNVTPESMPEKQHTILKYVHPNAYGEIKGYLQDELKKIKHHQQSRFFNPVRFEVDESKNIVAVIGDEIHLIGKREAYRERRTYEISFAYNNAQLYLNSFKRKVEEENNV